MIVRFAKTLERGGKAAASISLLGALQDSVTNFDGRKQKIKQIFVPKILISLVKFVIDELVARLTRKIDCSAMVNQICLVCFCSLVSMNPVPTTTARQATEKKRITHKIAKFSSGLINEDYCYLRLHMMT